MTRRITAVSAGVAHLVGPGSLNVVNGHLAYGQTGRPSIRLDPTALTSVTCYGDVSVSGAALELLFRHAIPASWLTPAGNRCRGRLARPDASATLTRVRQHRAFARPEARLDWARTVVVGKVDAMTVAARHYQRHGAPTCGRLLGELAEWSKKVSTAEALPVLLGLEGAASAAWFRTYATLVRPPWTFPGRTRRPPTDSLNALLSLGYTWLLNRAVARAEARGYEVYLGGLHEYRAGRPSLACDLIEPLRVPAVDRWAVAVCNQLAVRPDDFTQEEGGGYRLRPRRFGHVLHSWETHWTTAGIDLTMGKWLEVLSGVVKRWDQTPDFDGSTTDDL